jgi:hypothetical protein
MRRTLLAPAALASLLSGFGIAHAGELPEDIWSGKHGGHPSITANQSGVSITLPTQAIADAGGGSVTQLAQSFLEKYAPGMCSEVFDFQSPHKGLKVEVALMERVDIGIPFLHYYEVSPTYTAVKFDYTPSRTVKCVTPEPLTS